jgi:uncharacterized membrane protein
MDKPLNAFAHSPSLPQVTHVETLRPLRWVQLGWEDLRANPGPSLGHGFVLAALGWIILLLCSTHIDLLVASISGFLLVGPVFGAGFYELSRLRATGQPAAFDASLDGALRNAGSLVRLGILLAVFGIAWVGTSHLLFTREFGEAMPRVGVNLYRTVVDWDDYGFLVNYLATGAVFALAAFVVSAVAAPTIFERAADTRTAILTSVKAVAANPAAMLVWAALIVVLTAIGFATFLVGLVIVLPLLGHSTWHAYRDLVR